MRRIHLFVVAWAALTCAAWLAWAAERAPTFSVINVRQFELSKLVLCRLPQIREQLKFSPSETFAVGMIDLHLNKELAAARKLATAAEFRQAITATQARAEADLLENLDPAQRNKLDGIQLQLAGPTAFAEDNLLVRLKPTREQMKQLIALAGSAETETAAAARIPLPFEVGDTTITPEAIREFVSSETFLTAKQQAWQAVFDRRAAVLARIEKVLDQDQLATYRHLLGDPVDVDKFFRSVALDGGDAEDDLREVALELRLDGGQRSDPTFPVTVDHPAYAETHPTVLFDEAHHNFHTTTGRYKPFVDLITSDGYQITANHDKFTPPLLVNFDLLVIANAMAAEWGHGGEQNSAFTDEECQAVDDWVNRGGALLLITDHAPFGAGAVKLATRFGVDMSMTVTSDPANTQDFGLLFARQQERLGDHAIINGRDDSERINHVLTFTGQSLKGPEGSVALLKFADTAVDSGNGGDVSAAGRAQGVALRHGQGRVVVMGEAAELSAQIVGFPPERFGMNTPGCDNRQLALNIMHWLTGLLDERKEPAAEPKE